MTPTHKINARNIWWFGDDKEPKGDKCLCVGRSLLKYGGHGRLTIIFSKEVTVMKDQAMKILEEACPRQREQQVARF